MAMSEGPIVRKTGATTGGIEEIAGKIGVIAEGIEVIAGTMTGIAEAMERIVGMIREIAGTIERIAGMVARGNIEQIIGMALVKNAGEMVTERKSVDWIGLMKQPASMVNMDATMPVAMAIAAITANRVSTDTIKRGS